MAPSPITPAKTRKRHILHTSSKHPIPSEGVSAIKRKKIKKKTFTLQVATRSKLSEISQSLNNAIESNNQNDTLKFALALQKHPESVCQETLNKALLSACNNGNKFLVQTLFLCNIDVNCRDVSGNTPLMICAVKGFCNIAQMLIQRGADINCFNNKGDTALILSISNSGSTNMVKLLLYQDTIDIFHKNLESSTCLSKAVQSLDFDLVKIILKKAHSLRSSRDKYLHNFFFILRARRTASRLGLHKIFIYIEEEISQHRSALLSAVHASDHESINFLLNYISAHELRDGWRNDSLLVLILDFYEKVGVNNEDVEIVRKIIDNIKPPKYFLRREKGILSQAVNTGNCELLGLLCLYVNKHERTFENIYNKAYFQGVSAVIEKNDFDSLQVLLQYRPDLMYLCKHNTKLINKAFRKGAAYFLEIFLNQERQLDVAESLLITIQHSQTISFDLILEKLNEKALSAIRDNILRFFNIAVKVCNKDIITRLLGLGADVNGIYEEETPLMCCRTPEIALIMLENGADINVHVGYKKSTALLNLFTQKFHNGPKPVIIDTNTFLMKNLDILLNLVSLYIRHDANVEDKNYFGQTAVILASKVWNCGKVLKFLLDSGANPNIPDNNGRTALYFAISESCFQNVQILTNYKADVNAQCFCGESCLHLAAALKENITLKTLVENGGNVNIEDNKGNSPLLKAIKHRNIEVIKFLIETGSDVNHQNKDGASALMIAAEHCYTEIVTLLCDNGALINLRNPVDGNNAVDIMIESTLILLKVKEAVKCIEYLLQNGGNAANVKGPTVLCLVCIGQFRLLQKLIDAGLSPTESPREMCDYNLRQYFLGPAISPFSYSLLFNRTKIAKHLSDISFLTSEDVNDRQRIRNVRARLVNLDYQKSLDILDELTSQPVSLERLCLVTVSSALGTGIHRGEKITQLPLPAMFKDRLMFKTQSIYKERDETNEDFSDIDNDFYDSDSAEDIFDF